MDSPRGCVNGVAPWVRECVTGVAPWVRKLRLLLLLLQVLRLLLHILLLLVLLTVQERLLRAYSWLRTAFLSPALRNHARCSTPVWFAPPVRRSAPLARASLRGDFAHTL